MNCVIAEAFQLLLKVRVFLSSFLLFVTFLIGTFFPTLFVTMQLLCISRMSIVPYFVAHGNLFRRTSDHRFSLFKLHDFKTKKVT